MTKKKKKRFTLGWGGNVGFSIRDEKIKNIRSVWTNEEIVMFFSNWYVKQMPFILIYPTLNSDTTVADGNMH